MANTELVFTETVNRLLSTVLPGIQGRSETTALHQPYWSIMPLNSTDVQYGHPRPQKQLSRILHSSWGAKGDSRWTNCFHHHPEKCQKHFGQNPQHADFLQTMRFDDPMTGENFTPGIVLFYMHLEWPTCDWISLPQGIFLTLHLNAVFDCTCYGCFELQYDGVCLMCTKVQNVRERKIHHTHWNMISLESLLYVAKRLADSYVLHSRHRTTLDFICCVFLST